MTASQPSRDHATADRTTKGNNMVVAANKEGLVALANKTYAARRKVDQIFAFEGFAVSPAWDVMLDLYRAMARGTDMSVTSASAGACCPPTTALRWLNLLEEMRLIKKVSDATDRRRTIIHLTDDAIAKTEAALQLHV